MNEKFVVPGGNIYQTKLELDSDKSMQRAIHELYFNAYQNIIREIGLHDNLELGLHIRVNRVNRMPEYFTDELRCIIETIPIIQKELSYIDTRIDTIEPYMPHNRKCTLKERFKILFRGEL